MKRLTLVLCLLILLFIVGCDESSSISDPTVRATYDYWAEARPIIERQIEQFGRPIAELYVELSSEINEGDTLALGRYIGEMSDRFEYLGNAILELSNLKPPAGIAAEWHLTTLEAWGSRANAVTCYVMCWDADLGCTEQEWLICDEYWYEARTAGMEADRLQIELANWLEGKIDD